MSQERNRKKTVILSDPCTDYANKVVSGEIIAGPFVRKACQRHLRDLKNGPSRGLSWDIPAYMRFVNFCRDILTLGDGEHDGIPFILTPFQVFIAGNIFGWMNSDGYRRFRTAYVEIGKGNGKSPMSAAIGIYMLCADGEAGAECYAAAVTREQAKIQFRDAVRMVQASPQLSRIIELSGQREVFNLAYIRKGSYFRPISSEGRALDGKRVHFAGIDEVHEHPTSVVVEKMRAGTKGRRQALILEITNSGYDRSSICYQHHELSRRVLDGEVEDDSWFCYVCALDEGDDPFNDRSCWEKANPNLGVSISERYLEERVREARNMPADESKIMRVNFCCWVDAADPWISREVWLPCEKTEDEFDFSKLAGKKCYGGLDLSGTGDLTAFDLEFPYEDKLVGMTWYWTPLDTLAERERKDAVPYSLWVKQGHLRATPGKTVDYRFVAQEIADIVGAFQLQSIAFDPYRIKYFERDMRDIGVDFPLVPHGQGYYKSQESMLWMPRSIECLSARAMKKTLIVKKNPVLTWNSSSAVLEADQKENKIFAKRKSTGRIDGIVAKAMAVGNADQGLTKPKSFWETMDVTEL